VCAWYLLERLKTTGINHIIAFPTAQNTPHMKRVIGQIRTGTAQESVLRVMTDWNHHTLDYVWSSVTVRATAAANWEIYVKDDANRQQCEIPAWRNCGIIRR
jgi:hypothetical protein